MSIQPRARNENRRKTGLYWIFAFAKMTALIGLSRTPIRDRRMTIEKNLYGIRTNRRLFVLPGLRLFQLPG